MTTEQVAVPFKAEVKQLLTILAHSLYTDREIFLRELISNASDAMHRLQFEMLTNQDVLDPEAELAVRIVADSEAKTLTISDAGTGMTADELTANLGTIAQSGTRALIERLEAGQRGNIIGQFGVGFYSAFVVADKVTVTSRSYRSDAEAAVWRSDGGETFSVGPAEKADRGTTIVLKLKDDADDFLQEWKLRQIVTKHSNYVAFPVYIGEQRANAQQALWRTSPRSVTQDQYNDFYQQLTYDFSPPLFQLHLSTDAPVDLHTILFVPSKRERGMIERRVEGKIQLYSRKVLIQEEAKDLLPNHFRFIDGVVDSEDLPLNVAREGVQGSATLARIKKSLAGRLTKELGDLAEKDAAKYGAFWDEFGVFIKEGVAVDASARADLTPLLRFATTRSGDEQISLATYAARMADGQDEIYYVIGGDLSSARRSPHLEALEERGLEALLLFDVMDSFMLGGLTEYEGHKLRNADDQNLTLPGEGSQSEALISDEQFTKIVTKVREVLGERVTSVRASQLLRTSAIRLISPDEDRGRDMARVQRMFDKDYHVPARIVEINRAHPLVAGLAARLDANDDDPIAAALIEQLYDSALLIEGLHPNPAEMVGRIQRLMEAAVRAS